MKGRFHLGTIPIIRKQRDWLGGVKVINPKYSKHWPYAVAHTIDCVCSKMLNHVLNHELFLSLFKLIPCHKHWIACVLAYINFIFDFHFKAVLTLPKMAPSAQIHKSISFNWIVWSTLYVYLWVGSEKCQFLVTFCNIYAEVKWVGQKMSKKSADAI